MPSSVLWAASVATRWIARDEKFVGELCLRGHQNRLNSSGLAMQQQVLQQEELTPSQQTAQHTMSDWVKQRAAELTAEWRHELNMAFTAAELTAATKAAAADSSDADAAVADSAAADGAAALSDAETVPGVFSDTELAETHLDETQVDGNSSDADTFVT